MHEKTIQQLFELLTHDIYASYLGFALYRRQSGSCFAAPCKHKFGQNNILLGQSPSLFKTKQKQKAFVDRVQHDNLHGNTGYVYC